MKRILVAALAVTLLTGSVVAAARDHDRGRHSRHDDRASQRDHGRHGYHHNRRDDARHVHRNVHRHVDLHRHVRFHAGHYYRPAGYRAHAWHRGARLPAAYYAPRYIVHDHRAYRLYQPPRGHHWVRVDRDVVLAAIATGAVVAVVHELFY